VNLIYGIVIDKVWHSNRMIRQIHYNIANGIYRIDMESDDFMSTIQPANISDARTYFSKSSKVKVLRGISFHDAFVPENPVNFTNIPIKVKDCVCDEFEEIEVAMLNGNCYFLQIVYGQNAYPLLDLKLAFDNKQTIEKIKGVTPPMRVVYAFHSIERKQEELRKALSQPENIIRQIMSEGGATVDFVKKNNRGFEVQWKLDGETINTQLDNDFRVKEAGFCVSNWDGTQSARSLVNVLSDYSNDGSYIHKTRTVK